MEMKTNTTKQTKSWEEKIRQDYAGILSEEQINTTIQYWKEILALQQKQSLAELREKVEKMECLHYRKDPIKVIHKEDVLALLQDKEGEECE